MTIVEKARGPLSKAVKYAFAQRWKHEPLFHRGYVVVPTTFLQVYADLKPHRLTGGEALFVIHLMEFKWDSADPFPGNRRLAQRMGLSDKMVRRYAQSLERKGYLRRHRRTGETNRFDLSPLFDALLKAALQDERQPAASHDQLSGSTDLPGLPTAQSDSEAASPSHQ
jgi:DNA-binding MarR family transcriptional regulator